MTDRLPIDRFRDALENAGSLVKAKRDDDLMAQCPAHEDRNPSLHVNLGQDDRVLVTCHAGCELDAILAALKLTPADLFPPRDEPWTPTPTVLRTVPQTADRYDYHDADGQLIYQVVRREPKGFWQRQPDGKGGWISHMRGVERLPYRLPQLVNSTGGIYVVEGEKDADRLAAAGLTATTNAGGAGKFDPGLARWLEGRDVAIVPDNDEPGRDHALQVAAILQPVAASVRIVDLGLTTEKHDVSDWMDAGHTADELRTLTLATPTLDEAPDAPAHERTSWWKVDLAGIVDGTYVRPQPTELRRDDGLALLYPAATNAILGESESGKSWLAQHAAAQTLIRGDTVAYLDFESDAETVAGRLLMLGVPGEVLVERFAYIHPDANMHEVARADLFELLDDLAPALVVIDGVTDAMGLHGFNLIDNADVAKFDQLLPRPLAATGAAVVTVDHVPKSKEGDAKYAIGGQHKRAAVQGASYRVDVVTPFAPGRAGWAKVTIAKDRPGSVRQQVVNVAAEFHLDATDPDRPIAELREPRDARQPGETFRPTVLMERVSHALEAAPDGLSGRELTEEVTGRAQHIRTAVRVLVDEGYIVARQGERNATLHVSVRPFREDANSDRVPTILSDRVPASDRVPDLFPADSSPPEPERVPASPPLQKGGRGRGRGGTTETDPSETCHGCGRKPVRKAATGTWWCATCWPAESEVAS